MPRFVTRGPASIAALLLLLTGCLAVFGPNLRARGAHAGLAAGQTADPDATCMDCHESEAEALARMNGGGMMSASGPPLVADWMLTDARPCTACHEVRE